MAEVAGLTGLTADDLLKAYASVAKPRIHATDVRSEGLDSEEVPDDYWRRPDPDEIRAEIDGENPDDDNPVGVERIDPKGHTLW